jgi:hypothetical protein
MTLVIRILIDIGEVNLNNREMEIPIPIVKTDK